MIQYMISNDVRFHLQIYLIYLELLFTKVVSILLQDLKYNTSYEFVVSEISCLLTPKFIHIHLYLIIYLPLYMH